MEREGLVEVRVEPVRKTGEGRRFGSTRFAGGCFCVMAMGQQDYILFLCCVDHSPIPGWVLQVSCLGLGARFAVRQPWLPSSVVV
jgi:hypothetical protein